MLRGFRWQLLALLISIIVFSVVFALRLRDLPPTIATPSPTLQLSATTAPTNTPLPTQPPVALATDVVLADDGILIFTEALVGDVDRLNPLLVASQAERDITALIFNGLTTINTYGEAVGDLALDWTMSRNGYEYVVQLREDVLWQDGTPFSADDVIFTYDLLAHPDFSIAVIGRFWQTVEIQKIDDYLVRFYLTQPLASFPSLLTTGILPVHALAGSDPSQLLTHPFNVSPIGTGAYQLETLRSADGQRITQVDLRAAPTYQARSTEAFMLSRIRFQLYSDFDAAAQALADGRVDGLMAHEWSQRLQLLGISDVDILSALDPSVGMLIFNWDEGEERRFFQDLRVRTALQTGLDRRGVIEGSLLNQAVLANSPLLPSSWAYDETLAWPSPDPARAFEVLQNANISVPENETDDDTLYEFTIMVRDMPSLAQVARQIAGQWSQFNLSVSVDTVTDDIFAQRLIDGDFDSAIVELPLGVDPDVYAYWHADQYPDGLNYGGVIDSRISELLERGRQDVSGLGREAIYRDFQRVFVSQAIALPLYYPLFTYAVGNDIDGVQLGFISTPSDRFRTLARWTR